jgi:VanZ family protein
MASPGTRRVQDAVLWTLASLALVALVGLSLVPDPPTGGTGLSDKVLHGIGYAVVTFLLLLAAVWAPWGGRKPLPKAWWAVAAAVVSLGAGIELMQSLVPNRTPELLDVVANVVGVVTGTSVWARVRTGVPAS